MRILPALLAVFIAAISLPARPSSAQADRLCFPGVPGITNCIEGRFREYWEENGGLAIFGYPTSPAGMQQSSQGTFLTQYFERNRFELHPENARPYDVLLGRLGDEQLTQQGRNWVDFEKGKQSANCLYFTETNHAVCDQANGLGFKSYWERNGLRIPGLSDYQQSLALFGLPLSEPAVETNQAGESVLTQWFERARFEWHPNKPDEFKVLLGLLGNEITTNVVRDGDFEAPVIPQRFATAQAGQKIGAWTVESGSVDLNSPQYQAATGKQSLDLTGEEPGAIYQDVPTVPRQTYRLRFAMAGNPDRPGIKRMAVAWGDDTIASLSFDAFKTSRTNMGWVYHEYTVVAEGRRTRLTFRSETGENHFGPMIDDVSLRQMTPGRDE